MKKLIPIFFVAAIFAGCSSQPKQPVVVVDTMAIKQQAIQEEQARAQQLAAQKEAEDARIAEVRREERARRRSITTMNENANLQEEAPAPVAEKKKGWSDAAKGTAIGAGVGALAGGLIDKNHVAGAVIGGVVGGGSGYLIGRANDRKTGRVVKKKKPVENPQQ